MSPRSPTEGVRRAGACPRPARATPRDLLGAAARRSGNAATARPQARSRRAAAGPRLARRPGPPRRPCYTGRRRSAHRFPAQGERRWRASHRPRGAAAHASRTAAAAPAARSPAPRVRPPVWARALLGYTGLALLLTWPLALHLGDRFPGQRQVDAWLHYWNIWWFKTAAAGRRSPPTTPTCCSAGRDRPLPAHPRALQRPAGARAGAAGRPAGRLQPAGPAQHRLGRPGRLPAGARPDRPGRRRVRRRRGCRRLALPDGPPHLGHLNVGRARLAAAGRARAAGRGGRPPAPPPAGGAGRADGRAVRVAHDPRRRARRARPGRRPAAGGPGHARRLGGGRAHGGGAGAGRPADAAAAPSRRARGGRGGGGGGAGAAPGGRQLGQPARLRACRRTSTRCGAAAVGQLARGPPDRVAGEGSVSLGGWSLALAALGAVAPRGRALPWLASAGWASPWRSARCVHVGRSAGEATTPYELLRPLPYLQMRAQAGPLQRAGRAGAGGAGGRSARAGWPTGSPGGSRPP